MGWGWGGFLPVLHLPRMGGAHGVVSAVCLWIGRLPSLSLGFLICKMREKFRVLALLGPSVSLLVQELGKGGGREGNR